MSVYLVVDDSPTIRLAVTANLRRVAAGRVDIIEADAPGPAIKAFAEKKPTVVFLDMMLTDAGGGLGLMKEMLAHRPDARIVLLTGLAPDHAEVRQAISLGAFAHLQKPVRFEAIRQVFEQLEREEGRLRRIK